MTGIYEVYESLNKPLFYGCLGGIILITDAYRRIYNIRKRKKTEANSNKGSLEEITDSSGSDSPTIE